MDDIRDLKLLASEKAAGLGMDSIICFLKQAAKEPTAPKREGVKALTEHQANWLKAIQARKMSDYARVLLVRNDKVLESSALEALKAAIRQADIITPKDIMRCLFRVAFNPANHENYNPLPKRMRSLLGAQFNYRCDANLSQCILALGTDGQGVTVNKIISDLIDNAVLGYREEWPHKNLPQSLTALQEADCRGIEEGFLGNDEGDSRREAVKTPLIPAHSNGGDKGMGSNDVKALPGGQKSCPPTR
ncbi:Hypothetical protein FKW44_014776 [Caligus rogercresseyi]|uniref:Uncharacterized protein n=1 Tax=Caligus rogercresseyi TaxID=217165 RepID=A0A7T8GZG1_CALRO|nr:Hypothetical protein FKW44_014776 [Caligus rogercresseyi]